jgi:hypothetical protein
MDNLRTSMNLEELKDKFRRKRLQPQEVTDAHWWIGHHIIRGTDPVEREADPRIIEARQVIAAWEAIQTSRKPKP